jgi:hypothetical protein
MRRREKRCFVAFGCTGREDRSGCKSLRRAGGTVARQRIFDTIEHIGIGHAARATVIEGAARNVAERSLRCFDDRFGVGYPWTARVRVHHGDGTCGRPQERIEAICIGPEDDMKRAATTLRTRSPESMEDASHHPHRSVRRTPSNLAISLMRSQTIEVSPA